MQMIDVLKRLAELDAKNPNVVSEISQGRETTEGAKMPFDDPDQGVTERYDEWDEADMWYRFDDESGTLKQRSWKHALSRQAKASGWRETHDAALRDAGIIRSKFDPKKFVKNVGGKWVEVFPYGTPSTSTSNPNPNQDPQNTLKENNNLQECGMMGSDMNRPRTPASINMTADSGTELTGMLRDIMQLAGMKQVGTGDLGHEHEPAVVSAEPSLGASNVNGEPLDMKSMIATIDTLNDPEGDDTGTPNDDDMPVKEWDNETPRDLDGDMRNDAILNTGMHNHDQSGGEHAAKGRNFKNNPVAYPETMYENLMAEYRKFVSESQKKKLSEIQGSRPIDKFRSKPSWDDGSEPADKNSPYYVAWSGQAWDDEDTSRPKGDAGRILAINIEDKHTAQELAKHYDQLFKVGKFPDELAHSKYVDYSGTYVGSMKKMDSYDREMLNYDMKAGQVKDYSKSEI